MRTVLVTGGAGFIGSHLVDELLRRQWIVTVVDDLDSFYDPLLKRSNIAGQLGHPRYTFVEADVRDPVQLNALVPGHFDSVVHLAGRPGVLPSLNNAPLYHDINVRGTKSVLDFAKKRGIPQVVFASSSSVYGLNPAVPWREDRDLPKPASPYAETKVASELMGESYASLFGIRFVALRLFTAYGPRQRPDLVIHKFAQAMTAGRPITVYGDLDGLRDYTFVDDLVCGISAALDYTATAFEIINLGAGCPQALGCVVECLERVLDVRAILEFLPRQTGDLPRTAADITKARDLLGFAPATKLEEGLAAFAAWFRNQPVRI